MSNDDTEHWDSFWKRRHENRLGRFIKWVRKHFVTPRLAELIQRNTEAGGVLVEAGCGTGEVSREVARRSGQRVVLVDISSEALVMAKAAFDNIAIQVRTVECDITKLSLCLGSIPDACVYNIGVVEHFADCTEVLQEMVAVGGRPALAVIPEKSIFWRFFVALSRQLGLVPKDFFIILFSEKDFRAVVMNAGLRIIRVDRIRIFGVVPYLGICFSAVQPRD